MKIGLVLAAVPGYSETFFRNKIKVLTQAGHQVTVFTSYTSEKSDLKICTAPKIYKSNKVRFAISLFSVLLSLFIFKPKVLSRFIKEERSEGKSLSHSLKIAYLNRHILKSNLDWLHFGFTTLTVDRENLAGAIGAKMATSFRGYDINVYPLKFPNIYQSIWLKLDKVHSISDDLYFKAKGMGLRNDVSYKKITPAIDVTHFRSLEKRTYGSDQIKIFTVARLTWIKGLDYAISAMRLLKEKELDFKYTIAGSGIVYDRIKFAVHQYELDENVIFLGAVDSDEILQQMQNSDIYLQPSLEEGFCNAVLEAQACKCLCIASDIGGLRENIIDNETGWLVPKRSPKAIVNKIQEVYNLSDEKKQSVCQRASERVAEKFSLQVQEKAFVEFYD